MSDPSAAKVASDAVEHVANGADKVANAAGAVGEALAGQLGAIGRAMGKVAPEAWDILVRQQTVDGIVDLAMWMAAWGTFFGLIRAARFLASRCGGYARGDNPTLAVVPCIVAGVLCAGQIITGYWYIPTSIKQVANPKYYAAAALLAAAGKPVP